VIALYIEASAGQSLCGNGEVDLPKKPSCPVYRGSEAGTGQPFTHRGAADLTALRWRIRRAGSSGTVSDGNVRYLLDAGLSSQSKVGVS